MMIICDEKQYDFAINLNSPSLSYFVNYRKSIIDDLRRLHLELLRCEFNIGCELKKFSAEEITIAKYGPYCYDNGQPNIKKISKYCKNLKLSHSEERCELFMKYSKFNGSVDSFIKEHYKVFPKKYRDVIREVL